VRKSQAIMLAACERRNSRQFGPPRGAGSSLAPERTRRMLVAETTKPSLRSSGTLWEPRTETLEHLEVRALFVAS